MVETNQTLNYNWNPLEAAQILYDNYFNFFLTSFAPNNPDLQQKLTNELKKEYLQQGPYISISKQYKLGIPLSNFEKDRLSDKTKSAFSYISSLYLHQEAGINNILNGNNTIAAIPTGSGKTEIFLIPLLDYCIKHRGEPGIKAIIVYPMNALANDQVERLRKILWVINQDLPHNEQIKFALYNSDTPENLYDLSRGEKSLEGLLENCFIPDNYTKLYKCDPNCRKRNIAYDSTSERMYCSINQQISIDYQILTRESIRKELPDILITNYVQLEHLMLRKKDNSLFYNSNIKFLIFDEIHTYSGAKGVDVAYLIRRLRNRLTSNSNNPPICIGLSATLSTADNATRKTDIAKFAEKIFGSQFNESDIIEGIFENKIHETPIKINKIEQINEIDNITDLNDSSIQISMINSIRDKIYPVDKVILEKPYSKSIGKLLIKNPLFQLIERSLNEPIDLKYLREIIRMDANLGPLFTNYSDNEMDHILWSYLKLGSLSTDPRFSKNIDVTLINVHVHNFFKTIDKLYKCNHCNKIYLQPRDSCNECGYSVDEIGVCRFCGKEYIISLVESDGLKNWKEHQKNNRKLKKLDVKNIDEPIRLKKIDYQKEYTSDILPLWQCDDAPKEVDNDDEEIIQVKKCKKCGSILNNDDVNCVFCRSTDLKNTHIIIRKKFKSITDDNGIEVGISKETQIHNCPFCGSSYGSFSALSNISMSSNTTSVTIFDLVYTLLPEDYRKLLIFTDNRQAASYLAGYLEDGHLEHSIRGLLYTIINERKRIYLPELLNEAITQISNWYGGNFDDYDISRQNIVIKILKEIASMGGSQRSIENLGLIEITYNSLDDSTKFDKIWNQFSQTKNIINKENPELWRNYLISLLNIFRTDGALKGLEKNNMGKDKLIGYSIDIENRKKDGIVVKGILYPKAYSIRLLTRNTFNIKEKNSEELSNILKTAMEFFTLKTLNLMINITLRKNMKKSAADAYVVNDNNVILRIPINIWKCDKCKSIYTNVPSDKCITYRCDGILTKYNYEDYIVNLNNYYVNLYTKQLPMKMVTKEDTGALDLRERRKIESEFKKDSLEGRQVDVIVATSTLELGVDIGNLLSVGLYKAPPSPSNYIQRVGRAGRKEKVSFNNTFLFLTPIDKFYYNTPEKLIKGEIEPPIINLENIHILQRHVNSLILECVSLYSPEDYPYLMKSFTPQYSEKLIKDTTKYNHELKETISSTLKDQYKQLTDEKIEKMISNFQTSVNNSIIRYHQELAKYHERYTQLKQDNELDEAKKLYKQILKFEKESFASYLMDMNVLPRYAFPGVVVDLKENFHLEDYGQRARNIAITEYAPLMEIYLKKKIYKSIGIDRSISVSYKKSFYICSSCQKYITDQVNPIQQYCPICHSKMKSKKIDCIEPNIIYITDTHKRINEPKLYQEAISNIYLDRPPIEETVLDEDNNITLSRYGNIEITTIVDKILIDRDEYPLEICSECGRVHDFSSRRDFHWKLDQGYNKERCTGRFERLALSHKMPTNVISIKLSNNAKVLFGANINFDINVLLNTLKNAIINSALYYSQAQDGEIDGEVIGNEIILYDNVDGGAGYVDKIYYHFIDILKLASDIILDCDCENGCLDCLWSFRRKRDINNIDKNSIVEILSNVKKIPTKNLKKNENTSRADLIRTLYSSKYDYKGLLELRDSIRNAKKEITIFTDYVSNAKIFWPDETGKSWVDILIGKKSTSRNVVNITIITKEPMLTEHKIALKKLFDNDISVYLYKNKEIKQIKNLTLISIDPYVPSQRIAYHISGNLSPELWKNNISIEMGDNDNWVKSTYAELEHVIKKSSMAAIEDIDVLDTFKSIIFKPGKVKKENLNSITSEFSNAKSKIYIMDPYTTQLEEFENLIKNYVHKGVEITLVTAIIGKNNDINDIAKLNNILNNLRSDGFTISVIDYYDDRRYMQKTVIHDRYIVFDEKRVIVLGKGLDTIYEAIQQKIKKNTIASFISNNYEVKEYIENFFIYTSFNGNTIVNNFSKKVY